MDDGAGGDDSAVADHHTGQNGRVRADHHLIADHDIPEAVFVNQIFVGENGRIVADDAVAADMDFLREENVRHDRKGEGGLLADVDAEKRAVQPAFQRQKRRVAPDLDDDDVFQHFPKRYGAIQLPERVRPLNGVFGRPSH